jgi:preprotein translocase subunit YajC
MKERGRNMEQYLGYLPIIGMLVVFYLVIFIPESRRKKKYTTMLNELKVNDEVVTKGGIVGKIVNLQDDYIIIQTGPDRARIKVTKNGISHVINNTTETK